MTARLFTETRVTLARLAAEENVHAATAWRWATRGVRGIVLESFIVGGKRRVTTREAYRRWLAAINGETVGDGQTPKQRERSIAKAEAELDQLGV